MKLVLFTVGDREFGVDIGQIREVMRSAVALPIPDTPPWVDGIIEMRGEVIPVISLRRKLGLPEASEARSANRVIIADQSGRSFGVAVEHVTSVIKLDPSDVSGPNPMLQEADYITGVAQVHGTLVPIMDLFLMADREGRFEPVADGRGDESEASGRPFGVTV